LIFFSSCVTKVENSGYSLDNIDLSELKEGSSTKDNVLDILGTPSAKSSFGNENWLYLSSKQEAVAFMAPEEKERKAIVISFNNHDIVEKISSYGLEDGHDVVFTKDYISTEGDNLGVVKQFIGNIGRFKGESSRRKLKGQQ
jgi:outer membrane protein assembly factor BamE (lipoprotein component of BamABCDE complex)